MPNGSASSGPAAQASHDDEDPEPAIPAWMDDAPPYEDFASSSSSPSPPSPRVSAAEQAHEESDGEPEEEEEEEFDPALGYLLAGIDDRWLTVVREAANKSRHLAANLAHGRFLGVEKKGGTAVLKVLFDRRPNLDTVVEAAAAGELSEALAPFGKGAVLDAKARDGEDTKVPSIAEAQRTAAAKAQQDLELHAREHPVVKKALELFGGEVRQVRREP